MPLTIFSGFALFMSITILFRIFYGIANLMFHPTEDSLKKFGKLSSALAIAIVIFIFTVFFANFFFARSGNYGSQFSFSNIAMQIGSRLNLPF